MKTLTQHEARVFGLGIVCLKKMYSLGGFDLRGISGFSKPTLSLIHI